MLLVFFFFSSRRRHTRYIGDWSSDVCSSDLPWGEGDRHELERRQVASGETPRRRRHAEPHDSEDLAGGARAHQQAGRSEERRVGKEGRSGGAQYTCKKEKRQVQ